MGDACSELVIRTDASWLRVCVSSGVPAPGSGSSYHARPAPLGTASAVQMERRRSRCTQVYVHPDPRCDLFAACP